MIKIFLYGVLLPAVMTVLLFITFLVCWFKLDIYKKLFGDKNSVKHSGSQEKISDIHSDNALSDVDTQKRMKTDASSPTPSEISSDNNSEVSIHIYHEIDDDGDNDDYMEPINSTNQSITTKQYLGKTSAYHIMMKQSSDHFPYSNGSPPYSNGSHEVFVISECASDSHTCPDIIHSNLTQNIAHFHHTQNDKHHRQCYFHNIGNNSGSHLNVKKNLDHAKRVYPGYPQRCSSILV